MKKSMTIVVLSIALLGIFTGNLLAITKTEIREAVATWAGVSVETVTAQTELDGLGGRQWPPDSPTLIPSLQELAGQVIPPSMYIPWVAVDDIYEDLGADDEEE